MSKHQERSGFYFLSASRLCLTLFCSLPYLLLCSALAESESDVEQSELTRSHLNAPFVQEGMNPNGSKVKESQATSSADSAVAREGSFSNGDGKKKGPQPTIRSIKVEIRDVFDEPDLGAFYHLANNLKISTKEQIIKRELLFKEGDKYNPFVLAESARNLRLIPYLRQVKITPQRSTEGNAEVVDITVSVQDTWTLFPFISFYSGGGSKKQSIGIAETDLLGLGKRVELLYADDEGREKIEGVYDDRRFMGTQQQLTLGLFDRSDGYRAVGFYGSPFRSLVQSSGWNIDVDAFDLVGKLFQNGEERFIFRQQHQAASAGYTFARGDAGTEGTVRRYTFGYDYSNTDFKEADADDYENADVDPLDAPPNPELLAEDREFTGPFFAMQRVEADFVSLNFVDRFERVEDYNLGNDFYARLTFASDFLGSQKDTLLYNISDSDGWRLSPTSFLRGRIGFNSRMTTESFRNSILSSELRYYNVLGPQYLWGLYAGKHTFVVSSSIAMADELDRDRELLLGSDTGLRGYDNRTFTGDNRLLLSVEHRVYVAEDLFHLISLGTAAFADLGGASQRGLGDTFTDDLYSDIGVGLRIGFPRSSGGSVLRIDLAFPTRDGPDGTEAWSPRLLVTTGQSVTARIPSESEQAGGSNVTVKFLP